MQIYQTVVSDNEEDTSEKMSAPHTPLRDTGGMKWFSFFDPDGNRIDVMQNRPRPF
jgi:hypothetical protein